jgi:hypothetical protein
MLSPWDLQKLGGKLHIIHAILDHLNAAFTSVILCPRVAVKTVSLVACMAGP